jgi:hypothetical protein
MPNAGALLEGGGAPRRAGPDRPLLPRRGAVSVSHAVSPAPYVMPLHCLNDANLPSDTYWLIPPAPTD